MAHAQKPDFVFQRNGRVHLNRRGRQFSRLLAAEVCVSAVVMLDTPRSEVVWRMLATNSIRQFPLHFPSRVSPCAITFQLESKAWEPSDKTMLFRQTGSIGQKCVGMLLSQNCQWRMIKRAVAKCAIPVCVFLRNSGINAEVWNWETFNKICQYVTSVIKVDELSKYGRKLYDRYT
jgi:hypothetical protein